MMSTFFHKSKSSESGWRSSVAVFAWFARQYPARTLTSIGCLFFAGIAELLSITLFLPLLEMLTKGEAMGKGVLHDAISRVFALMQLEVSFASVLVFIVAGLIAKGVLYWGALSQVGGTVSRVSTDLRLALLQTMLQAKWSYFTHQPAGHFANAIASEALKASGAYLSMAYILASAIQFSVYLVMSLMLSWPTAIAGFGAGLIFLGLMHRLIQISRQAGKKQVVLLKSVTSRIVDMVHGLKPIRAMAREKALVHYLESEAEELNAAQRTEVRAAAAVVSAQEPVMAVIMGFGLYILLTQQWIPLASLLLLAFLFSRMFNQVNLMVQHYQRLVSYESAFHSISDRIAEAKAQGELLGGRLPPLPLKAGISLRDVHFRYGDHVVLDHVSLTFPNCSWTTLTGTSGAGKTTLLDLLVGLHQPELGAVCLDDQPLAVTNLNAWRRCIGYVPQEMLLLHDSIFANISLGESEIDAASVQQALRDAGVWEFVSSLPQGMDTPVGERGSRLSGGQRQRIALARALVRNPQLLILDEATASLDPETERSLCETLKQLSRRITIVAISHQPAVALAADQVYELCNGSISLRHRETDSA